LISYTQNQIVRNGQVESSGGAIVMASGKSDEVKGRVEEAAGVLTGDEKLKRKGKADQAGGKVKQVAEKIQKKTEEAIDKVKDALS